jgi:hypothetical protein
MVNLGKGGSVEKPTTEAELIKALGEAQSFEQVEILVRDYNSSFDEAYRHGQKAEDYAATVMPQLDRILLRKEFDDCDAVVIQRNRVTELQKKKKMSINDTVNVERSNKQIESGWTIEYMDSEGVLVSKGDNEKTITYSRLLEMNSSAGI